MVRAARNGVAVGGVVAVLVLLLAWVPVLARGYPLALLPLLAAGPVAVPREPQPLRRLLAYGFVAGLAAAVVAVAALACAVEVLDARFWALIGPASYPPMPPLPRPDFLPVVTWPQEDILLILPPLSAVWAAVYGRFLGTPGTGLVATLQDRLAHVRASLETKLVWLLLALSVFAVALGWLGFGTLEEIHLRGHTFQYQTHWIGHVVALGDQVTDLAAAAEPPPSPEREAALAQRVQAIRQQLDHIERPTPHPGIAVSGPSLQQLAARFQPEMAAVRAATERLIEGATQAGGAPPPAALAAATAEALRAQRALAGRLQADLWEALNGTDFQHHASLMALLGLVAVSALAGLLLGQAAAGSIVRPIGAVGVQLNRIAQGDFAPRLAIPNRDELGELAARLNAMSIELDRLYTVEREGRRTAEALAARERELNAARELWAHTIVHDLKSPLTVASGYVELLLHGTYGPLSQPQTEAAREIADSLQRVLERAQTIVDLFRLEQANVPVEARAERPEALLRAAARAARRPGRLPIKVEVAEEMDEVTADARLVQRVLENLISNAYQHGGEGVAVTLRARSDGEAATFVVEDDGPGIPPSERERVFRLFEHAASVRRSTGLGLTFCKAAVERHGGRIWIDAAPSGGAQVCFTLPLARAAALR